ncbi:hypothetical protein ACLKA6_019849 [Drosophila palustris]
MPIDIAQDDEDDASSSSFSQFSCHFSSNCSLSRKMRLVAEVVAVVLSCQTVVLSSCGLPWQLSRIELD